MDSPGNDQNHQKNDYRHLIKGVVLPAVPFYSLSAGRVCGLAMPEFATK
jgi:hypothetical protein